MAVTEQSPISIFTANGVTTVFAFSFLILQAGDMVVQVVDTNGSTTTKVLGVDYTVSGIGSATGGAVTFLAAPSNLSKVVLFRSTQLARTTDYQDNGDLLAETVNADFDRLWMALQEGYSVIGQRAVRAPTGETLAEIPVASARAGYLLGFNSSGDPVAVAAVSGTAASLALDLANGASPSKGGGQVAYNYAVNYAVGTLGWVATHGVGIDITQPPYNADSTGAADVSGAIAACWAAFPGVPMRAPRGTYKITASVALSVAAFSGAFGPGPKIYGDGIGVTIFDNQVVNGAMFDIDSNTGDNHVTFKGVMGVELKGFTIKTSTSPANSTAIKLRTSYMVRMEQVRIIGMTADGLRIPTTVGDNDGSNMVSLKHVWIENCAGWGMNVGDPGHNETSWINLENVFFQSCGTAQATVNLANPPLSGGMKWAGQMLIMESCAFANGVQNVGLYVPGQSGLAQTVDLRNVAFENCYKRSVYCTGISNFKARNCQFYSNDTFVAQNAVEFDGTNNTVRQVDIDGSVVRATAGNNAYTAFKIAGANADFKTCRVKNTVWDNFDYAGQTRFNGWQFEKVSQDCDLVTLSTTSVLFRPNQTLGRGNKSPLRLRGGGGGTPSTTGEWVAAEIPNVGVAITNAGLAASTRYYCYLYDNNGVLALELSTTGQTIDTATGYPVKSGDTTRLYVGSVLTDAGILFVTAGGGWLNPMLIPGSQPGVYTRMWTDSTNRLRVRYAIDPTSDTDGTIVGTQV